FCSFGRCYLDGRIKHDTTDRSRRFSMRSILCEAGESATEAMAGTQPALALAGRIHRHGLLLHRGYKAPDGGGMHAGSMLSAPRAGNLSVVIAPPIPWYGGFLGREDPGPLGSGITSARRAGASHLEIEHFGHPRERRDRPGSQFSHDAAAMHLDGHFADRKLVRDLLVHQA